MIRIFTTTRFEGFHAWPDAPKEVSFLGFRHRHEFHVKVWQKVTNEERETEFILYKRMINKAIETLHTVNDTSLWSCETWARRIGEAVGADQVEVSEDGESGSEWTRSP